MKKKKLIKIAIIIISICILTQLYYKNIKKIIISVELNLPVYLVLAGSFEHVASLYYPNGDGEYIAAIKVSDDAMQRLISNLDVSIWSSTTTAQIPDSLREAVVDVCDSPFRKNDFKQYISYMNKAGIYWSYIEKTPPIISSGGFIDSIELIIYTNYSFAMIIEELNTIFYLHSSL